MIQATGKVVEQRYTVVLAPPDQDGWVSATVPAMPGCVSQGRSREECLAHVREAMAAWLEVEAEWGRVALPETPDLILEGVGDAMRVIDEMRVAGELPSQSGYDLELATVEVRQPITA